MKRDKNFYYNIIAFVGAPILFVIGVVAAVRGDSNRLKALGGLLILLAIMILLYQLTKFLVARSEKKAARNDEKKRVMNKQKREKALESEKREFIARTDTPQTNTVKIGNDIEFFAEGRYVCEHNFKGVLGYHFGFEINSTELKHKAEDYDDVCDIESSGIVISVGYHDGEALEKYANDNGVILKSDAVDCVGQTLTLMKDCGYNTCVWTAEGDEIDYGFVKILKRDGDVLTVWFRLNVPYGLCEIVEGVVELKKDSTETPTDIHSIIDKIKRKKYNFVSVDEDEVQAIRKSNPFLPDSYITLLTKLGFVDFNWIDVGMNAHTPTNLDKNDYAEVKETLVKCDGDHKVDDYYFIGIDNDGRRYAFSKKTGDGKVYVFSASDTDVTTYASFEELLGEILYV